MVLDSGAVETDEGEITPLDRRSYLRLLSASGVGLMLGGAGTGLLTNPIQPAQASSSGEFTVDDFEDQDLSEWTAELGVVSDWSYASETEVPVPSGTYALKTNPGNADCYLYSNSGDGLPNYISKGSRFRVYFRTQDATANHNYFFIFGHQDIDNRYSVEIRWGPQRVELEKHISGIASHIAPAVTGVSWESNQWYVLTVTWDNGTLGGVNGDITAVVNEYDVASATIGTEIASVTGNDTSPELQNNTGVALYSYTPNGVAQYIDNFHLLEDPSLDTFVVDDFEDQDLNGWTGDTSDFSITGQATVPPPNGAWVLQADPGTLSSYISSTTGLQTYPAKGSKFRAYFRTQDASQSHNAYLGFGFADEDHNYSAEIRWGPNKLELNKSSVSQNTLLTSTNVVWNSNRWYALTVTWDDGTLGGADNDITVEIHEYDPATDTHTYLTEITANDSEYAANTGVFLLAYNPDGLAQYIDYYHLLPTSPTEEVSVLATFEDGDLSKYTGDTGSFGVQSGTALEGSLSLEATTANSQLASSAISTPRGYEYRCHVQATSGSGAGPALIIGDQNPATPFQDAYFVRGDIGTNQLTLGRRDAGNTITLESVIATLSEGTEYQLAIEYLDYAIRGVVYDATGVELAATTAHPDTTYSGGYLGFDTGGGQPTYFDYVTKRTPRWYNCER